MARKRTKVDTRFAGIYGLYCPATDKWYVGASDQVETRIKTHIREIKKGNHPMSKDVLECGQLEVCIFERIEDKSQLTTREQYWVDQKDSYKNGYNRHPPGRNIWWSNKWH